MDPLPASISDFTVIPYFYPGNQLVAVPTDDGIFIARLTSEQKLQRVFPTCPCEDALISADWSIAAVSREGYVEIWNLRNGRQVRDLLAPGTVSALALSGNSRYIAIGTPSGSVSIFDLRADRPPSHFKAAQGGVNSLYLSENGRVLLVTSERGRSTVWTMH
jgi:WD40 repeat protein